jgi:hypothetical protein
MADALDLQIARGPGQADFSPLGNLFKDFSEGQKARREADLDKARKAAAVVGPDGKPDFGATALNLLRAGDIQGAHGIAALAQQTPEYIDKLTRQKLQAEQDFAPKTVDIKEPGPYGTTTTRTVERGPGGFRPVQVQGAAPGAQPSDTPEGIQPGALQPAANWTEAEKQYFATVPPGERGAAAYGIKMARGEAPVLAGAAIRSPFGQAVLTHASGADPTFDLASAGTRFTTAKDYASGPTSQNLRALNTVPHHLEDFAKSVDALPNVGGPLSKPINAVIGTYLESSNNPNWQGVKLKQAAVATEMAKVFRGTGTMSEKEIGDWTAKLGTSNSPDSFKEIIKSAVNLIAGRMDAVQSHYNKVMGPSRPLQVMDESAVESWKRILQWSRGELTGDKLKSALPGQRDAPAAGEAKQPAAAVQPVKTKEEANLRIQQAREAIANGKDPKAVIETLRRMGIQGTGLLNDGQSVR